MSVSYFIMALGIGLVTHFNRVSQTELHRICQEKYLLWRPILMLFINCGAGLGIVRESILFWQLNRKGKPHNLPAPDARREE